jgi:FNIP Repeat
MATLLHQIRSLVAYELILSKSFCGSVAELPQTLYSFKAAAGYSPNITAMQSVLQRLPSGLQRLQLIGSYHQRVILNHGPQHGLQADPALVMIGIATSGIQLVRCSMRLPTCLQELYLSYCKFSGGLQLPATLRKLELKYCSSSSSDESFSAHLNDGLQHVVIKNWYRVELGSDVPSTLTYLVLHDESRAPLGELPAELQHLDLNRRLSESIEPLHSSLRVLKLGDKYTQPLGTLPDTLIELRLGRKFDWPLGSLPQSLKSLRVGESFTQHLGPLTLQLEHLS